MEKITRRRAIQTGAAAGGLAGLAKLETLVATEAETASTAGSVAEEWVPTTCWIGKQDCGILARRVGGAVVKLEGHPDHPRNQGGLCPKGAAQIMALYDPNRVKTPLRRTNEKGVPGKWEPLSWDEALTRVGDRVKEVRAKDPSLLCWQKGRSKAKAFYDDGFVKASGATKLHHGGFCSDAGYRACEYTIGLHGVLHPDFRHTRYLLAWGWNITNAGGNKLCWITWPRQLADARERGMKVTAIDPRARGAGPFADDWLPIRPGADLALALALCHVLVAQGTIDRDYLTKHTNAPFLVGEDGLFLRLDGKEQVWDTITGSARQAEAPGVHPALEGEFTVNGAKVKPAFEVFKEHVARYTPEWGADECGVSAEQIRRIAGELAENAQIGSTIVVDGVTVPHRPVAIMAYHMSQQELGFQAVRAMLMVPMLLGAVGAAGGQRIDFTWKVHKNYDALDHIDIKDPPYNIYLKDSKYFPINSNNSSLAARALVNPTKYGVQFTPEVLLLHMCNPAVSFPDQPAIIKAYTRFKFVVVIDPWLSKTADLFADVILPASTMEKYEGPLGVSDQYTDATALRVPPMEPVFDSRDDIAIYLDLCERADILYGEGGYLDHVNKALKLEPPHALPLDKKPTVREVFDRWAKSQGFENGVAFFEENGLEVKGHVPAEKYYGYAADPPFGGVRHRLYGESLLCYQQEMRGKGVEEIYWRDYTELPTWRPLTMDESPSDYDLYLISFKKIENKQSRSSMVPLLAELAPKQYLVINPETARARGIRDRQEVWIESQNAITGETRKLQVEARHFAGIRPDTVGMSHSYGGVARHPWAENQGPTPNTLFFTGEGYVSNSADQSFHVKVKVYA